VVDEAAELPAADEKQRKAFKLLLESLQALRRENRDVLWSSLIKETIKRKRPSFNEAFYGYKSFGRLLEDAARRGILELTRDAQNRSYVVTRFGAEMAARPSEAPEAAEAAAAAEPVAKPASRARSSRRRSRKS
jgi:hypothetical protein